MALIQCSRFVVGLVMSPELEAEQTEYVEACKDFLQLLANVKVFYRDDHGIQQVKQSRALRRGLIKKLNYDSKDVAFYVHLYHSSVPDHFCCTVSLNTTAFRLRFKKVTKEVRIQ